MQSAGETPQGVLYMITSLLCIALLAVTADAQHPRIEQAALSDAPEPQSSCAAQLADPSGPIALTGSLPVHTFGVIPGNSSARGYVEQFDQAPGIRQAISCFSAVSFGPGDFLVNTTIVLADEDPARDVQIGQFVRLRGVSAQKPPRTKLYSDNASSFGGAVLQLGDWDAKYSSGATYAVESMQIEGVFVGVRIVATNSVSFSRVLVQARQWAVATDGNDIVRDNTAMLISGCFWLAFEKSEFHAPTPPGPWSKHNLGTRPSVILRGEESPTGALATNNVQSVYLLRFTQTTFWYGGLRYEYNVPPDKGGPPIGFWDFLTVAQEDSFTPLIEITGNSTRPLDAHGQPQVKFAQISIQGYMNADSGYNASSVIRMNLTNASLDGVTMFGIGDVPNAVEVVQGQLGSITVLDSRQGGVVQWQGGEHADGTNSNTPMGSTMTKSTGGIAVVGFNPNCPERTVGCRLVRGWNDSTIYGQTGYSEAAVMIAQEGDSHARLAIRADGSMAYGSINEETRETEPGYDTIIRRPIARRVSWKPPTLAAGAHTAVNVTVRGATPGDAVSVGMSQLGEADVLLSANVAAAGRVRVVLRNAGPSALVLPDGIVSVVVTQFI